MLVLRKISRIVAFVGSESQLLAVSYNEKYFSFMVKTKAIRLVTVV